MNDIIRRLRAKRRADEGFTLIELLVVVVIIGVLVAIAVPVYLSYRQGAADRAAQSDIRGAISTAEQYYTQKNDYPITVSGDNSSGGTPTLALGTTGLVITLSDGTKLGFTHAALAKTYTICATNTGGSDKWFKYDSLVAGSVKASVVASPTMSTC